MVVNSKGFSLVELVLVLVIIGLLSAVAIPRYIEANNEKEHAMRNEIGGSVKAAWQVAKADTGTMPSVAILAAYVQGEEVAATSEGINLVRNGDRFMVSTFRDASCSSPTQSASDIVLCVSGTAN